MVIRAVLLYVLCSCYVICHLIALSALQLRHLHLQLALGCQLGTIIISTICFAIRPKSPNHQIMYDINYHHSLFLLTTTPLIFPAQFFRTHRRFQFLTSTILLPSTFLFTTTRQILLHFNFEIKLLIIIPYHTSYQIHKMLF